MSVKTWNDPTGASESEIFDDQLGRWRRMTAEEHRKNNLSYYDKSANKQKIAARIADEDSCDHSAYQY